MSRIKFWIRDFFGFSRRETNAFLILLPLMFVLIFSEPIYRYWFVRQPQDFSKETKSLDSLIAALKWKEVDSSAKIITKTKLFSFDPNQASKDELMQLGFNTTLANRIINYRTKGGKFAVKKDLMKIYGMDSSFFKTLYPLINLPENIFKEKPIQKLETKSKPTFVKFDLNTADTSQLIKIYGIGSKLSTRIVTYREKLGGFLSMTQLKEVYGLDSLVINELANKSFIEENYQPKQININSASEKELGSHPYIKYKIAKAIVAYRFQHGKFQSLDELKKIVLIDEEKFEKLKPYVAVN